MPHGTGLLGNWGSHSQSVLSVDKPGDPTIHYIFTARNDLVGTVGCVYSKLDMSLDGGLGDIVLSEKNVPLTGGLKCRIGVTATRHSNKKDSWIAYRNLDADSNFFVCYLVNNSGLVNNPICSNSVVAPLISAGPFTTSHLKYMKFTPDATRLVALYSDSLEICNFNSSTGQITSSFAFHPAYNNFQLPLGQEFEFSVDGNYIYFTAYNKIYRADIHSHSKEEFNASIDTVGTSQNAGHAAIQRGPDNRIYGTRDVNPFLWVINDPCQAGTGCGYVLDGFQLNSPSHADGLPFEVTRYKSYIHHTGSCLPEGVHFTQDTWPPPGISSWNFGDPASGNNNFSSLREPVHRFSALGTYTVTLIVKHIDNRIDTTSTTVLIDHGYQPDLGPDVTTCSSTPVTLDAGSCGTCVFTWTNTATSTVVGTGQTYTTGITGNYAVAANITGCIGRDTIAVLAGASPVILNNSLTSTICSGELTNIPLISNEVNTQFNWTSSLTSGNVTGFSADSGNVINQILTNTGAGVGVVTYHVIPKLGNCIGNGVDFTVTITPGDSVKISISGSLNNICSGTAVTYTAVPTGNGTLSYQWKVNNINQGTNNSSFNYIPVNGDVVTCVLASSNTVCTSNNPASSNAITMIVSPVLVVGVTLMPPLGPVCQGTQATFGTLVANGGLSPVYQWHVNGINVGTGQPAYSYIPSNGDLISCTVTSSEQCSSNNPASSILHPVSVSQNLPVSVTISASQNPVCSGIPVTYTATATNGGTNPSYQWQVNNINVGTNQSIYTYTPANNDIISCTLTSSEQCVTNPASSIQYPASVIQSPACSFQYCFDSITTTNAKPFRLKGGIPLGGTYTGPGVNSATGVFSPAITGIGTKTINYSYTNIGSCSDSKARSIIVQAPAGFICGGIFRDIRDNRDYSTALIGAQCWLAEDLNYGTEITLNQHQRDNCIPEKYHNPASGIQHPASAYDWDELMQYADIPGQQGLCPPAWHVPTEAEWQILFSNWTNSAFAASSLLSTGFSGFNALLPGVSYYNSGWKYPDWATFFWTSTSHGSDKAVSHGMNFIDPSVSTYYSSRINAFSVRCIKD